jgi:hypothetical protein
MALLSSKAQPRTPSGCGFVLRTCRSESASRREHRESLQAYGVRRGEEAKLTRSQENENAFFLTTKAEQLYENKQHYNIKTTSKAKSKAEPWWSEST